MSSSMVYGDFDEKEDENTHCKPIGIHELQKYAGELMVKSYNQIFDLHTIINFRLMVKDASRRVGQIFIENAIQNLDITINGDGEDKLDFTYIEDLYEGISLCCENNKALNETLILLWQCKKNK